MFRILVEKRVSGGIFQPNFLFYDGIVKSDCRKCDEDYASRDWQAF